MAARPPRAFGSDLKRGLTVGSVSFLIAWFVTLPSQRAMRGLPLLLSFVLLLLIVVAGVLADAVGLATAAASEAPFHAMATKRIAGARQAIQLIRNADKVTSIANDVIGDLAGTISGSAATAIAIRLFAQESSLEAGLLVALAASLTVGGKATMKGVALGHANEIVFLLARALAWVERSFHVTLLPDRRGR
ncbi:MAG: hypothetical protein K6U79_07555 [Firmicutes bacterium]|nr:hypothetical protein [Bacillota bacterium]